MAKIDAAYSYLLSTYGKAIGSRYDSHKKSELKNIYRSILKTNKDAPLYKIKRSDDMTRYAIDIKEHSRKILNVIASISDYGEDIASILHKKIANSSNEDLVSVNYVGNSSHPSMSSFDIEVQKLATPQVNQGNYLPRRGRSFEEGQFSFDLDTPSNSYEFQFNVNSGDTNFDVQSKIARLINQSDVGLTAEVITNNRDESALRISSRQTGLAKDENGLFRIQSGSSWREVNTLGIDRVTSQASNSMFLLNGKEHTSLSNTFTIDRAFELHLHREKPGVIVHIGFQANTDTVGDLMQEMIASYNGMIAVGQKYSQAHNNNRLLNEMGRIPRQMSAALEQVGITPDERGMLVLNREMLKKAILGADAPSHYQTLTRFKDALSREARRTSIDPMHYVDKVIVEYKNPRRSFFTPYAPSAYSGMLIDQLL